MNRKPIDLEDLTVRGHHLWAKQWLLLTAGTLEDHRFNMMTVAWGALGTMWNRPMAMVVVRPTRYTFEFMEKSEDFTLTAFPEAHRETLQLMGTTSGRDTDKIASSALTPIASSAVQSPAFDEAELVLECRKMYWNDFDPAHFVDPDIDRNYPSKDYHRMYFGQIVAAFGTETYRHG